jgi:hypothetical protein
MGSDLAEQIFSMGHPYVKMSSLADVAQLSWRYGVGFLIAWPLLLGLMKPVGTSLGSCRSKSSSLLLLSLAFLLLHGDWISNGYYFYDDMTHFKQIPMLNWDIVFANNGGQPYPIYFMIMKWIWLCFDGHPSIVNATIAVQIFLTAFFLRGWMLHLGLKKEIGDGFALFFLSLPQWLSFYCGGYVLMCYIHAVFFFGAALLCHAKWESGSHSCWFYMMLAMGFLGSVSSTSGAWVFPSLMLWFWARRRSLSASSLSGWTTLSWLGFTLALSLLYHVIFFKVIYTLGNTVRYDYGATFSLLYLVKNYIVLLGYLCASPWVFTSFQGVLPEGVISQFMLALNSFIMLGLTGWTVLRFKRAGQDIRCLLLFLVMLFLGVTFMIVLGRYAADLDKVLFHDKYLVMPAFFLYALIAVLAGEQWGERISVAKILPWFILWLGLQNFSSSFWETIQSNPLRHSVESSRNRRAFFESMIPRIVDGYAGRHDEPALIPTLTADQLFAAHSQTNGVYDIIPADLHEFMSYRFPELNERLNWLKPRKSPSDEYQLKEFRNWLLRSSLARHLFLSPLYFKGDVIEAIPPETHKFEVLKEHIYTLRIDLEALSSLDLWVQFENYRNSGFHTAYSQMVDIEVFGDTVFGRGHQLGVIRFSNLQQSRSLPWSSDGGYALNLDFKDQLSVALSEEFRITELRFVTPGHYRVDWKPSSDRH